MERIVDKEGSKIIIFVETKKNADILTRTMRQAKIIQNDCNYDMLRIIKIITGTMRQEKSLQNSCNNNNNKKKKKKKKKNKNKNTIIVYS